MKTGFKRRILAGVMAMFMLLGTLYTLPAKATVTVDLTNVTLTVYNAASAANILYLTSSQKPTDLASWDNHAADAADDNSGVWLKTSAGETKIEGCTIGWSGNDYYIGAFSPAAAAGDTLTIKGTFLSERGTSIIVPEMQFQYTDEGWVKEDVIRTVDLTDVALTVYNSVSAANIIYLTSNDKPTDLVNWDNHVANAEDENSGVWLKTQAGETKITGCTIGWSGNDYYIGAFSPAATAGDVLTIRGTFSSNNNTSIIVPEMKLEYTSAGWVTYVPDMTEYTELNITGINEWIAPAYEPEKERWNLYLSTSKDLPGESWAGAFAGVEIIVGNNKPIAVPVMKDNDGQMYVEIPKSVLAETITTNTKLVVKKGKASYDNIGIDVTSDYAIYVNEYGWSEDGFLTATVIQAIGLNENAMPVYDLEREKWHLYLTTDKKLPGEAWAGAFSGLKITINGKEADVEVQRDEWGGMYLDISGKVLPEKITKNTKIIVKAGVATSSVGAIRLANDFTIYANPYGFSTDGYVKKNAVIQTNAKLTLDRSLAYGGNKNGIYLNTTDQFPVDTSWATRIYAVEYDKESGVFYNGKKIDATLCRFADGKLYVTLNECGVTAKDKDKVVIKGSFVLNNKVVSYKEATFWFNGKVWNTKYEKAKAETYTKFAAKSVNQVSGWHEGRQAWRVYLNVDTMIPGELDITAFSGLKVQIGKKTFDVTAYRSYQDTLFFAIDEKYLSKDCADGIAITLKAGKALGDDQSTGVQLTKDFTFYTYKGSMTEQKPTSDTNWQEVTITRMERAMAFYKDSDCWLFHLRLKETLTTENGIVYLQLPILIDGKEYKVNATQDGELLYITIPSSILPANAKNATILIQANAKGYANAGRDGIKITEDWDAYLYNGVISEHKFLEDEETEAKIVGLQNVTEAEDRYHVYLRVNTEIPGTSWYEYYDDFVYYYNGKKISCTLNKSDSSNNKFVYFPIEESKVGKPKEGDIVTIKAGTKVHCGGYHITITNQFMLMYDDGIWSQYMDTDVNAPEDIGSLWSVARFDEGYIPTTEEGEVLYAGADTYNSVTSLEKLKDFTISFDVMKFYDDEATPPLRIILRGNPISEDEEMSYTLMNGYVITFDAQEIPNPDDPDAPSTWGGHINLWKNGQNDSLLDQYRISYVYDDSDHPYFQYEENYHFEVSIYNVTETCVCISMKINGQLALRYYDEAGSDPFDPAINEGTFAVQAICPIYISDDVVELETVIAEADECKVGDKVRVSATYPSVLTDAEFSVDKAGATVENGVFVAKKPGTYTITCSYQGKELTPKVITVAKSEETATVDTSANGIIFAVAGIIVLAGIVVIVILAIKKKKKKTEE